MSIQNLTHISHRPCRHASQGTICVACALLLDLHRPVKDVVVDEALAVEQIAKELTQIGIVWAILKAQLAAVVQIR